MVGAGVGVGVGGVGWGVGGWRGGGLRRQIKLFVCAAETGFFFFFSQGTSNG